MTPLPAHLPRAFLDRPIAHRALHDRAAGRIENGPRAIRAAVEAGYGIEIDLQLSADGVPVVFHDDDLSRLTDEEGPVGARTAAELAGIPLHGERIPRLAEALDLVGGRVPLLIEIKDQDGMMGPRVGALETAVAQALRDYDGPVAVMSFNPHSMIALRDLAPLVPRGLTTCGFEPGPWAPLPEAVRERLRGIPDYDEAGASFISHEARDLTRPRVAELKAAGARILCWTIRSPEAEREARRLAENVTFEGYLA